MNRTGDAKVRQPSQRTGWQRCLLIGPEQADMQALRVILVGLRNRKKVVFFREAKHEITIEIGFFAPPDPAGNEQYTKDSQ